MKKVIVSIFTFCCLFFLQGCFNRFEYLEAVPLYSGPKLPKSNVATLVIPRHSVDDTVIDENSVIVKYYVWLAKGPSYRIESNEDYIVVEMLPGKHKIHWTYKSELFWHSSKNRVTCKGAGTLDAKAGKYYKITFDYKKGKVVGTNKEISKNKIMTRETFELLSYTTYIMDLLEKREKSEDFTFE